MTFANTEATYGGTYTASPVGRRLEDNNLNDNGNSPLGPVTCSDGVTLGWTNSTAMNLALRITNYLCNVVNFEEACAPVFTICPDTPFEDVQPIVINQNDVVIQCGYNGTGVGAGGCILETSADFDAPGILIKDNTVTGQLLNATATPVTGITVKGMSFVNKGGSTSIGISTTLDIDNPLKIAASFDSCSFEDSDSMEGYAIYISPPNDEVAEFGSGAIHITKSKFINNHLNSMIAFTHNGTLAISDSIFQGNNLKSVSKFSCFLLCCAVLNVILITLCHSSIIQ